MASSPAKAVSSSIQLISVNYEKYEGYVIHSDECWVRQEYESKTYAFCGVEYSNDSNFISGRSIFVEGVYAPSPDPNEVDCESCLLIYLTQMKEQGE